MKSMVSKAKSVFKKLLPTKDGVLRRRKLLILIAVAVLLYGVAVFLSDKVDIQFKTACRTTCYEEIFRPCEKEYIDALKGCNKKRLTCFDNPPRNAEGWPQREWCNERYRACKEVPEEIKRHCYEKYISCKEDCESPLHITFP